MKMKILHCPKCEGFGGSVAHVGGSDFTIKCDRCNNTGHIIEE